MKNFITLTLHSVNFLTKKILGLTIAAFFCLLSNLSHSQPGTLDTSFNPSDTGFGNGDGTNYDIRSIALQSDGKMIIGGSFTNYNGSVINRIARLNADGSLDTTFNVGLGVSDGVIETIVLQGDGKILIGGGFGAYNGVARYNIARLNTDGSIDTTFDAGYINGSINAIAVQGDGEILIGGSFTTCNGIVRISIARLNNDGSLDTTFNLGMATNTSISCIAIQTDGKMLIGGNFTYNYYYNYFGNSKTISYKNIARFNNDGSTDTTFNPNPIPPPLLYITGTDGGIGSIVLLGNGKVIIGGAFTTYNGTPRGGIARLNTNGSLDTTFNPSTSVYDVIRSMTLQADGKVLIGGNGANLVARLNTDGSLDTTFSTDYSNNSIIYSIALQGNGKVLIGGNFTITYGGSVEKNIARLNVDGSTDTTFNPGTGADGQLNSIVVKTNGKVLIGGDFINYNGSGRNRIAQLNTDGSLDTTFNPGTGPNGLIACIAVQTDGKVIVGGDFTNYNGTERNGIARLNIDGSLDTTFNPGIGANGHVTCIAVQGDGKVFIGGNFTNYDGTEINRIARLNANGSLDSTFNPGTGPNAIPYAIALQGDEKLLIGGSFTNYNGMARSGIARLNTNGSLDTTFNPGTGTNGNISNVVNSIALQGDGKVIIAGFFTSYNGILRNTIARLYTNGGLDTAFNPITSPYRPLYSVAIQDDGKVIIGGIDITTDYKGFIARLNTNGSQDNVFNPGTGPDKGISTMAVIGDGKVLIGGLFTNYNGVGRNRIARINGNNTLTNSSFYKRSISIYPNPSNGIYTLKTNEINYAKSISIHNIMGQKIYDAAILSNENTIDISNQPKGTYLYKVTGEEGETKIGKLLIE